MHPATEQAAPARRDRGNSISETAQALRLSERTIWRQIRAGEIKAVRVSARRVVVTDSEINRVLSGQAG